MGGFATAGLSHFGRHDSPTKKVNKQLHLVALAVDSVHVLTDDQSAEWPPLAPASSHDRQALPPHDSPIYRMFRTQPDSAERSAPNGARQPAAGSPQGSTGVCWQTDSHAKRALPEE
jgi:hypothetical protein